MANVTYSNCLYCFKSFVIPSNHIYKKFCNLSCSTAHKNKVSKETKLQNYLSDPNYCNHCKSTIAYYSKKTSFVLAHVPLFTTTVEKIGPRYVLALQRDRN